MYGAVSAADQAREGARFSATFTFTKGEYDADFHALDAVIAEVAKSIPGYLGEESWENAAASLISNVYYWDSLAALQALMQHPAHQQAKQLQGRWLRGYQVVIAEVLRCYGDGGISHPLAGEPQALKNSSSAAAVSAGCSSGR